MKIKAKRNELFQVPEATVAPDNRTPHWTRPALALTGPLLGLRPHGPQARDGRRVCCQSLEAASLRSRCGQVGPPTRVPNEVPSVCLDLFQDTSRSGQGPPQWPHFT